MHSRRTPIVLTLCILVSLAAAGAVAESAANPSPACQRSGQGRQRGPDRWWLDEGLRGQLGLTRQQQEQIDRVFQSARPEIESLLEQLRKREGELDVLVRKNDADEAAVFSAIDRVQHVRYQINRNHVFMLYRMHRCLTPEQRAALGKVARSRR